ncbi:MAG: cation diffusion facilitator family transporter, partial [Flavobacteriales bacterium]|nr:cation diffusion facilitator family transporter [Flavobacteriales bacterium]
FRAQKFGKSVHIDCHVTVPFYLTVKEAHAEIDAMENLIREHHPQGVEMFIHTDPCEPKSCRICTKMECNVRQNPMEEKISWTLENVLDNKKHQ